MVALVSSEVYEQLDDCNGRVSDLSLRVPGSRLTGLPAVSLSKTLYPQSCKSSNF